MASTSAVFQPDSDVHISFEDQQKINKFARLNAKLEDLKDEIKSKENESKNLEDALDEIQLADDAETIPYLIGEIFIHQDVETTQKALESDKLQIKKDVEQLKHKIDEIKSSMSDLKTHLYGKFGSHINLEAEEE